MMVFVTWRLEFGDWRLEIGDWRLEIGDSSLEFGVWSSEFGDSILPQRTQSISRSSQSQISAANIDLEDFVTSVTPQCAPK